jgi:hypothetical protein
MQSDRQSLCDGRQWRAMRITGYWRTWSRPWGGTVSRDPHQQPPASCLFNAALHSASPFTVAAAACSGNLTERDGVPSFYWR